MKAFLSIPFLPALSRLFSLGLVAFLILPVSGFGQYTSQMTTIYRPAAVWGADDNNIWTTGDSGKIQYFNGKTWVPQPSPPTKSLNKFWGDNSKDVWAVGDTGTILYNNGRTWIKQDSQSKADLHSVWGEHRDAVWAVGEKGTILHFNGNTWAPQSSPTTKDLYDIWGFNSNDIWAVGDGGTILHYTDRKWIVQDSSLSLAYNLCGIWGTDNVNVWAVGPNGTILKYDGTNWVMNTLPSFAHISGICGVNSTNIWLAGQRGLILKYDGTKIDSSSIYRTTSHYAGSVWCTRNASIVAMISGNLYFSRTQCVKSTWYRDVDSDGCGSRIDSLIACNKPDGYVANNDDCDDSRDTVNLYRIEICNNGIDDDCDGLVDLLDKECQTKHNYPHEGGSDEITVNGGNMVGQHFSVPNDGFLMSLKLDGKPYTSGTTGGSVYVCVYEVTSPGMVTYKTQAQMVGSTSWLFDFHTQPEGRRQLKAGADYIFFVLHAGAFNSVLGGTRNPIAHAGQKGVVLTDPPTAIRGGGGYRSNGKELTQSPPPFFEFKDAPDNFILNYTLNVTEVK